MPHEGQTSVVCFTGTQTGMTEAQRLEVVVRLQQLRPQVVVHGDCVGSDAEFDSIARVLGIRREIYPSTIESKRAHCEKEGALVVAQPLPPLQRNDLIVLRIKKEGVLLATPSTPWERLRSGTWATVRRAPEGRTYVIAPSGEGRWR